MFAVEMYAAVRRFVFVEGRSRREAAKTFGISRTTVDKMSAYAAPPGYRRKVPAKRPRLDPFTRIIDAMQHADLRTRQLLRRSIDDAI